MPILQQHNNEHIRFTFVCDAIHHQSQTPAYECVTDSIYHAIDNVTRAGYIVYPVEQIVVCPVCAKTHTGWVDEVISPE